MHLIVCLGYTSKCYSWQYWVHYIGLWIASGVPECGVHSTSQPGLLFLVSHSGFSQYFLLFTPRHMILNNCMFNRGICDLLSSLSLLIAYKWCWTGPPAIAASLGQSISIPDRTSRIFADHFFSPTRWFVDTYPFFLSLFLILFRPAVCILH